jgi:hypothetical protein
MIIPIPEKTYAERLGAMRSGWLWVQKKKLVYKSGHT